METLRTEPDTGNQFAPALRSAIHRSRLSLDEISQRLRGRGNPVSASTLSYWQNGDNLPERAASLAAVGVLEELLGEPPGALTDLIGHRRPRGKWVPRAGTPLPSEKVWRSPEGFIRALTRMGITPEHVNLPRKISQHLSYRIDERGHEDSVRVRRLVQAEQDDTRRMYFITRCVTLPRPPMVTHADGCQPARFRADVPSSTCVFEFLLDRTLAAGELAAVEFGLRFPPGQADDHVELAITRPTRDLILQLTFAPERVPARCRAYWQPRNTLPRRDQLEARLSQDEHTFQFINLDPRPGQYGISWEWH